MLLTEFDAELHDKATYEAGRAEGKIEALAGLVVNGLISLDAAISQLNISEEDFIQQALSFNIYIKR